MKRLAAGWLCLLVACAVAFAQEVRTAPGVMVAVKAEGSKAVVWVNTNDALQVIEDSSGKSAVVCSRVAGKYKIAYVEGTKAVYVTIIVEGGNGPIPPPDAGELAKTLKAAYVKDADTGKASLLLLEALYDEWAGAIADAERSKDVKTWGALQAALKTSSKQVGLDTKVVSLRTAIAGHLKGAFPADASKALDADGRKLASTTFKALAAALKEVGK